MASFLQAAAQPGCDLTGCFGGGWGVGGVNCEVLIERPGPSEPFHSYDPVYFRVAGIMPAWEGCKQCNLHHRHLSI